MRTERRRMPAMAGKRRHCSESLQRDTSMQALPVSWQSVSLAGGLALALIASDAMAQTGQQDDASRNWFDRELRRYRNYSHLHEAYRLMQKNRLNEAARELAQGLAATPEHRETRLAYLQVLKRMNRAAEALRQANLYLARWPDDPAALLVRAYAHGRLGEPSRAARDYELVYRHDRAIPGDRLLAARAYAEIALATGEAEKAVAAIDVALALQDTTTLHLRRGQALAALKRYTEAEQAYTHALSRTKKPHEQRASLRGLADLAIVQKNMVKAVPHLQRLVELAPQELHTARQLVHAFYAQQNYEEAAVTAQKVSEKSADPADAFLLGTVLAAQGKHVQAQAAYARAAGTTDTRLRVKALLAEGYSAQAAGNPAAARNAFSRAARLEGGHRARRELAASPAQGEPASAADGVALRALRLAEQAYAAIAKAQSSQASQLFERALRLRERPSWRAQLAHVYRQQGDLVRARDTLAAFREPNVEQMRELAAVSLELGDTKTGIQILGKLARTSDRADDYLTLARAALAAGYTPVSTNAYRVAHAKLPELPRADQAALLAELGYVYLRSGETGPAYQLLEEAHIRAPSFPLAMELANLEERQGMAAAARERLGKVDPSGLAATEKQLWYATRARLARSAGDMNDAVALLQRGAAETPNAALHYELGLTALAAGNTPLARKHLDRARTLDPANWRADLQLGYVCQTQRDLDCAISAFERVAASQQGPVGLAETLAYTHLGRGDHEQAVAWFKRAIDEIDMQQAARMVRVGGNVHDQAAGQATTTTVSEIPLAQNGRPEAKREALRQQVGNMTRQWQLTGYQSVRRRGNQPSEAGVVGGGAVPSQGGLELQARIPGLTSRNGRILQLESRLLWSNRPGSLAIEDDTLQAMIGIAFKPFITQDAFLRLEKLIKIGEQSQNNWLLHGSWGMADGWGWNAVRSHWNYSTLYVDAGVMLQDEKTRSLYLEARQGRSFAVARKTVLTPYVLLVARRQNPDPSSASYIEAGAGVSFKTHFNGSRYAAERSNVELSLQYRKPLERQAGGWVLTGVVQF